ncbi:MAG TPA: hypothetical protein VIP09_14025 [Dehalococcoidia bacterium]
MSSAALPLALLVVLVELTVGTLWVLLLPQARRNAAASFIKFSAVLVFIMAAITFVLGSGISVGASVDGYQLDNFWMLEARSALVALFAASGLYAYATYRDHRVAELVIGGIAGVCGLAVLGSLAAVFSIPTWGFPLVLASFVLGAIAVGAVTNGMILGHWYLVTPRLPEQPLRQITGLLVVVLVVQALFIVLALLLPHDSLPLSSVQTGILSNLFFWLRVGLGLGFPAVLAWMAYDCSRARAMQSATGLLYLAMVLVICGEVVANGLLFVSAVPN